MKKTYTTFEVAGFCDVFHTTVINWVNKGRLPARLTPGGHRRIPYGDLIAFMKKYGMPIPERLGDVRSSVLVVGVGPLTGKTLPRLLGQLPVKPRVSICRDVVEALVRIGNKAPELLVFDLGMPLVDGSRVCRALKSNGMTNGMKIIGVAGRRLSAAKKRSLSRYCDAVFGKPFSAEELSAVAQRLIGA